MYRKASHGPGCLSILCDLPTEHSPKCSFPAAHFLEPRRRRMVDLLVRVVGVRGRRQGDGLFTPPPPPHTHTPCYHDDHGVCVCERITPLEGRYPGNQG